MKNNVISIFLFAMFITLPSCVDSGGQTNTDENNTYKQYDVEKYKVLYKNYLNNV